MIKFDEATLAQVNAADPIKSTWVSANAGSGKTRVLTDRVARLLLNGSDPQKILCLTYTNAAAAEMQNRLFKRLGEWAMMQDSDLLNALEKLGENPTALGEAKLRQARTLFASALETPGGLNIQTIHSFCDTLLRQFPVEAQVSPQFEILEDRQAKQLRSDILEQLAEDNTRATFERLAELYSGFEPDSLLQTIAFNHKRFTKRPTEDDFDLMSGMTAESIAQNAVSTDDSSLIQSMVSILCESDKKTDIALAETYGSIITLNDPMLILKSLIDVHLDKTRYEAKLKGPPTATIQKNFPTEIALLHDLMLRIQHAREALASYTAFERAVALYDFAKPFLAAYNQYKLEHGKLDYQDLIEKSLNLLSSSSMAQWVLYRLDGGIDHVLVDEAQDTNPEQWELIKCLTEEFTSGKGSSDTERTVFVVGDEKQSIYSFQGADPKYFGDMRDWFEERLIAIDNTLQKQDLLFSFRSAEPILSLVDNTFVGDARKGIMGEVLHRSFNMEKPGRVEIWPLIDTTSEPEDKPWYEPLDRPSDSDPKQQLAVKIAQWIDDTIKSGKQIKGEQGWRPVHAGDFLILVQSRAPLFRAIIKELKSRSLAVAGADRLEVGKELAVKDILSLLKFAATPEDDLSLAEAMRSPLLNISEGELFNLAHGRTATLWQSFREQKENYVSAYEVATDINNKADWMRPFELIERILTLHKGRENLLDRLGTEVEDGIDELLSLAMRYEQTEAPTLTGFLNWFSAGKVEIKREMDSTAGQIRVMTVHAAKGLEAPIVILPDTVGTRYVDHSETISLKDNLVGWKTTEKERNQTEKAAIEQKRDLAFQEKLRLLYVALTRAESWLVVCGAGKTGKEPALNWYSLVWQGMENSGAASTDNGMVFENAHWNIEGANIEKTSIPDQTSIPNWLTNNAPKITPREKTLSPSDLGGAKALALETDQFDEHSAKRRGTLIHLLLEYLPNTDQTQWSSLSQKVLKQYDSTIEEIEIESILEIAQRVISSENLKSLFDQNALTEIAITSHIPELQDKQIYGTIDRLIIDNDKILAVDFKSNLVVPNNPSAIPLGLLRQMGAYLSALRQIYPNHQIDVAILWTETQELMSLPHDIVIDALKTYTTS